MKKISGIHRAFIVATGVWTLFFLLLGKALPSITTPEGFIVWILPVGFMYGIVWVINGFCKEK